LGGQRVMCADWRRGELVRRTRDPGACTAALLAAKTNHAAAVRQPTPSRYECNWEPELLSKSRERVIAQAELLSRDCVTIGH
jgi:hypothetical protein